RRPGDGLPRRRRGAGPHPPGRRGPCPRSHRRPCDGCTPGEGTAGPGRLLPDDEGRPEGLRRAEPLRLERPAPRPHGAASPHDEGARPAGYGRTTPLTTAGRHCECVVRSSPAHALEAGDPLAAKPLPRPEATGSADAPWLG